MELEITADDPRPKAYLYTGGQSDYYFIVWMSSNPTVATVDGDVYKRQERRRPEPWP